MVRCGTRRARRAAAAWLAFKSSAVPALGVLGAMSMADPALAHHAMDGETPRTVWAGLASGLAHPVIGPDHLAAVVGIGVLSAVAGLGVGLVLAFLAPMLAGVAAGALTGLAGPELPVAVATLVIGGALIWPGATLAAPKWGLAAAAGLVHGLAYAGAIIGSEPTPLHAYLAGLFAMQLAIALVARTMASWAAMSAAAAPVPRAGIGLAVCIVGLQSIYSALA